jgi:chemotaxis protein CheD
MNHRLADPADVFLKPGEYFVGEKGRVRTLLGSCVSITLWHPQRRLGAMSHFLLWSRRGEHAALDARYGVDVMTLMLQGLARLGVRGNECDAKLFGGGNMFPAQTLAQPPGTAMAGVGQNNGSQARRLLQESGIRLVSESLFGVGHRQILFDLHSGEVWSRQVQPVNPTPSTWGDNL